jgi:hypothetical protein
LCYTQADSVEQLNYNCEEALNLYLGEPWSGVIVPRPDEALSGIDNCLAIPANAKIAVDISSRWK